MGCYLVQWLFYSAIIRLHAKAYSQVARSLIAPHGPRISTSNLEGSWEQAHAAHSPRIRKKIKRGLVTGPKLHSFTFFLRSKFPLAIYPAHTAPQSPSCLMPTLAAPFLEHVSLHIHQLLGCGEAEAGTEDYVCAALSGPVVLCCSFGGVR